MTYPSNDATTQLSMVLYILRGTGEIRRLADDLLPLYPRFLPSLYRSALQPDYLPIPASGQAGTVRLNGLDGYYVSGCSRK